MHYVIMKANSTAEMEELVRTACDDGWAPQGGITLVDEAGVVSPSGVNVLTFYQAMTRGDEPAADQIKEEPAAAEAVGEGTDV